MKRVHLTMKILLPLALGCLATPISVSAQIVPDGTLPENSRVNIEAEIIRIVGGTRARSNLFHSFSEFSVPAGITAYFDNALDLQNIIARVTGGNISNIDGILRANGSANLFLINPGGIAFGPDAALEVGGSFVASSADSVVFDNGFEFSAANPNASPLLAINIPIGLRFRENPGAIQVTGPGHNIFLDIFETITDDRPVGLQVATGKTLALLGGDVTLAGGNITAVEGRIEIWSGRGGSLSLTVNPQNIAIAEDRPPRQLGAIRLEQAASADVTGSGSGDVQIVGQSIVLSDDSFILANTRGSNDGGLVTVRATESVDILGSSTNELVSGISTQAELDSTGEGGSIKIETKRLTLSDGGISSIANGLGNGGNLEISTEQLTLTDGAFISSATFGTGNAGNVEIFIEQLTLTDRSQITASTLGAGSGGSLSVRAQTLEIIGGDEFGRSGLFASAFDFTEDGSGKGAGGDVNVIADRLVVRNGAIVTASNFQSLNLSPPGKGPAGSVSIQAREIRLDNEGIISAAAASGDRGNILLNADDIQLRRGSMVTASATGPATGGNITISTDNLAALENSDISANAQQNFGGRIAIQAQGIFGTKFRNRQTPQSDITATSELGAAFSGTVELNTPDVDPGAAIAIFSQTVVDVGRLIDQALCTQGRESSFTVSGRGGLPPNPADFLDSDLVSIEPIEPFDFAQESPSEARGEANTMQEREVPFLAASPRSEPSQIVPARGWIVKENGEVELVAYNTAASVVSEQERSRRGRPKCRLQAEKIGESWR